MGHICPARGPCARAPFTHAVRIAALYPRSAATRRSRSTPGAVSRGAAFPALKPESAYIFRNFHVTSRPDPIWGVCRKLASTGMAVVARAVVK